MENIIDKTYYESVKGLQEEILKDCDAWYRYVLNLPKNQQVTYVVVLFHSQVENGGLHQYFFNSYGQFAYLAVRNLKLIGAMQRAELLDTAIQLVNEEYSIEDIFRRLIFNREISKVVNFDRTLFKKLNDLDMEYYNLDNEIIEELLNQYLITLN